MREVILNVKNTRRGVELILYSKKKYKSCFLKTLFILWIWWRQILNFIKTLLYQNLLKNEFRSNHNSRLDTTQIIEQNKNTSFNTSLSQPLRLYSILNKSIKFHYQSQDTNILFTSYF